MPLDDSWEGDRHLVQIVSNLRKTELCKEHFDTDLHEHAAKNHDVEFALADEQGLEFQSLFTSTRCLSRRRKNILC